MAQNLRQVAGLLGRLAKPDQEYSGPAIAGTTFKPPAGLKTDKTICFILLEWVGRITVANAAIAALTVDSLGQLIQEIRVYGQHARFGNQRPIVIRGGFVRAQNSIFRYGYTPRDTASATWTGAEAAFDLRVFWTLPMFPLPMSLNLAPLYSLKGPDWAGNLFIECDIADATALGGIVANTTFSAYGSAVGNPTVNVSTIRPNMSVDLMNRLSPAITFKSYMPLEAVDQGANIANNAIATLNIGKRLVSFTVESGVLFAGLSANMRAYASMSDAIVGPVQTALDGKVLVTPPDGYTQQEWDSWLGGNVLPIGYNVYNFMRESANPDTGFPSETLTSARRFQVWGNVAGAAGQGGVLVQEEVLGTPAIAAATSATASS